MAFTQHGVTTIASTTKGAWSISGDTKGGAAGAGWRPVTLVNAPHGKSCWMSTPTTVKPNSWWRLVAAGGGWHGVRCRPY